MNTCEGQEEGGGRECIGGQDAKEERQKTAGTKCLSLFSVHYLSVGTLLRGEGGGSGRRRPRTRRRLFYEKYYKDVSREFDEFQVNTHLCKLRCWYL